MRGRLVTFSDFRGGINSEAAPYNIGANECRNARNVVSTLSGTLRKRDGSEQFVVIPIFATSLYAGTLPDTTTTPPAPPSPPPPDPPPPDPSL